HTSSVEHSQALATSSQRRTAQARSISASMAGSDFVVPRWYRLLCPPSPDRLELGTAGTAGTPGERIRQSSARFESGSRHAAGSRRDRPLGNPDDRGTASWYR